MRRNAEIAATAVTIENALLAHDYLAKIAALQAPRQEEADYAIPKGMKLRDEIGRYWRIAQAYWQDYAPRAQSLNADKTQKTWLEPLLNDVLGFDAKPLAAPKTVGERAFPITHEALDGTVPMLLTNAAHDLDRADPAFGDENRRRRSPHALLQEYLNADDNALWGIVSNGLKLRILRDNPSLTRPAYIEIDLERIFAEELYSEFVLFWLLAHRSRFEGGEGCSLEQWRGQSEEEGERALGELREGVMNALLLLGNGFLLHPENRDLKRALQDGVLSLEAFHQELLRLVYRLLFLFTAEERDLLFDPEATDEAKALYTQGYSLAKLRDLSLRHIVKDRYDDLWEAQKIVFGALAKGEPILGLPALGGLFDPAQCPTLDTARLGNYYLLGAVRHLAFFKRRGVLSRINYRDMDTEELGSVYESLLELIPQIDHAAPSPFGFMGHTAGSARKLSGSYYTPDDLVQELIRSALVPIIEERLAGAADPVETLLSLRVIDPASGSGHFLLAAARKIAEYLAPYLAEGGQPTQKEYRHALREVISRCIYGVDLNPLAVELCKTALWLEALEPGKPLGFLDSKIQCGNALVGLYDGELLKRGIPQEAYKALSGDDKEVCKELAKENKSHAKELAVDLKYNLEAVWDFAQMPEESVDDIRAKSQAWRALQRKLQAVRLKEDLYTAAFFAPKTEATKDLVPTNRHLRLMAQGQSVDETMVEHVRRLAHKHRFFHWHLAFADVFAEKGGFDCVLGNPPWEKIKLQEKEFFAARAPEIANAQNAAARNRMIAALKTEHPALYRAFIEAKHAAEATSLFVRAGRFPLTATGDINLYALFAEQMLRLRANEGRTGVIVPTGIATDDGTKAYFSHIAEGGKLVSLIDFENREGIFPSVHRSYKFCLLTLGKSPQAKLLFFATNIRHLKEEERWFTLTPEEFTLINPNTKTCPIFRTKTDAELTKKLYRAAPVLIREATEETDEVNPWKIRFQAMFHMSNDSHLFQTYDDLLAQDGTLEGNRFRVGEDLYLPLYEAKMIHHYDHRWATYLPNGTDTRDMTPEEKADPAKLPLPRYWVHEHEVLLRTADAPKAFLNALKNDDPQAALREAIQLWLLGAFITQNDPRGETLQKEAAATGLIDESPEEAKAMALAHPLSDRQTERLWQALQEADLTEASWEILRERAPKFLMGFRDITNSTNERTMLSTAIPFSGVGNNLPLFIFDSKMPPKHSILLQANLTSLCFDFVARQKVGGTHMNFYIIKQLPILSPDQYTQADIDYILPRVLELGYTAYDMKPWAKSLGYHGDPYGWDEARRLRLKCQLDAYYAHLYGLSRDELRYILDPADIKGEDFPSVTFPGLKRKEMEKYGEYRTQRLVLEEYDNLKEKR